MLSIGGVSFHIYGLLIGLGMWIALEVSLKAAERLQLKKSLVEKSFWWTVISGIIGARIYHVMDLWNSVYKLQPVSTLYIWNGGLGIWGGLAGGFIGMYLFWKSSKIDVSLLKFIDVMILGVPLAQAIGRWGNFANGELYGTATDLPWGILVPELDIRVHPLFLYESILDLALFGVLAFTVKTKNYKEGRILGTYLVGYGIIRFLLESLRPWETIWKWNGIPMAQIFSLVAITVGVITIKKSHRQM